ncbi:MAG: hypothetical protein RR645_01490, partial [Clostridium sp.]
NKEIPILSQSFGILSLCSCSKLIKHHEKRLSLSMLKAADIIFDFTIKNMKSGEGQFISFEDKTAGCKDSLLLKRTDKYPNLLSQVFLHEAFLTLYVETYNSKYKHYFKDNSLYLEESRKLFNHLYDNHTILLDLSSKDLSSIISSLYRCCSLETNQDYLSSYRHLIAILCAELDSRLRSTGEIERCDSDSNVSSIITHFKCLGAFIESYLETGIEKFKESSEKVFSHIVSLHDVLSGLFINKNDHKLSYTSKDVAEIIKSLALYYTFHEDTKALDMLNTFYKTSIEDSSLIASTPDRCPEFLSKEIRVPDTIPLYEQVKKAPIILKGFKINTKKSPHPITSKSFNSFYSLYASYMFSYYLSPIIEHKKILRGEVSSRDNDFLEDIFYNVINNQKESTPKDSDNPNTELNESLNEKIALNISD